MISAGRVVAEGTPAGLREPHDEQATVAWQEPDGSPRSELTAAPTRTVAALTLRFDGEIPGLMITRPTLEDVYLRLTGQEPAL